jgi:hypothetical protein
VEAPFSGGKSFEKVVEVFIPGKALFSYEIWEVTQPMWSTLEVDDFPCPL